MSLKLSVERMSDDGLYGSTGNHYMMIKNGELAIELIKRDDRYGNLFFKAGRFVAATIIEANKPIYCFFDFKKEIPTALEIVQKYYKTDFNNAELFLYILQRVNDNYERDYNEVELILDESFEQTFISHN